MSKCDVCKKRQDKYTVIYPIPVKNINNIELKMNSLLTNVMNMKQKLCIFCYNAKQNKSND